MISRLKRQQIKLCSAIAIGTSIAIALPIPTLAAVFTDPLILIVVDQVTSEGYNPPTFYIRGEHYDEQLPAGPFPLDWLGEPAPDDRSDLNLDLDDPIAPATSTPLQQQEVPDHD